MKTEQKRKPLSSVVVQKLLRDRSVDQRTFVTEMVAENYTSNAFKSREKELAEEIFRLLAKDIAERVRITLSRGVAHSQNLPRDVAIALAKDISDLVANPILQFSNALNTDDMLQTVKEGNESRQMAIALRESVDGKVCTTLAEIGKEKAVVALMTNTTANIDRASFKVVFDRFKDKEAVHRGLLDRSDLPETIMEKLFDTVSEDLRTLIVEKYKLNEKKAESIVKKSQKKTIDTITARSTDQETQIVIRGLKHQDKLTPSLVVLSICIGETMFFENSIAFLTGIPVGNIRKLMYDAGNLGLPSLYKRAKLPIKLFPAARLAIDLMKRTKYTGEDQSMRQNFCDEVNQKLKTMLGNKINPKDGYDTEDLLSILFE